VDDTEISQHLITTEGKPNSTRLWFYVDRYAFL